MLVLRIAIGVIFIAHGIMKFGSWQQPVAGMNIVMMILSIAEPVGGAALILGILAQWAALGLGVIMVGAIYLKQFAWGGSFIGTSGPAWEFDAVLLASLLVLLCYGPGRLSLAGLMRKA